MLRAQKRWQERQKGLLGLETGGWGSKRAKGAENGTSGPESKWETGGEASKRVARFGMGRRGRKRVREALQRGAGTAGAGVALAGATGAGAARTGTAGSGGCQLVLVRRVIWWGARNTRSGSNACRSGDVGDVGGAVS